MSTWNQLIPANEISEKFIRAEFYAPEFRTVDGLIKKFPHKKLNKLAKKIFQGWSPEGGVKNQKGVPAIKVQDLSGYGVSFDFKCADVETIDVPERAWAKQDDIYVIRCAHHPRYIGLNIDNYCEREKQPLPFITEKIIVARGVAQNANTGYVTSFLRTNYGYLQVQRRLGGLSANYTPADFGEIQIPLPAPKIQEYIGQKVVIAEKCREEAKRNRILVDKLFESILRERVSYSKNEQTRKVLAEDLTIDWLNSNYYRQIYKDLLMHLDKYSVSLAPLKKIAECNRRKEKPNGDISYIEISDIDNVNGTISGARKCSPENTPNNAQRIIKKGDILMSTRRPDRGAVAYVEDNIDNAFCSVFLAKIQVHDKSLSRFIHEYLRTNTAKLFIGQRCTVTTYPVISEDDIETIPVPVVSPELVSNIAEASKKASLYKKFADRLVLKAKSDVESLIEGKLDTDAILSGKLKATTWEEIEKELEGI